jgi:hypothetical protein
MNLPIAELDLTLLATGVAWAGLVVMAFWIWQKSKAAVNWLLLLGALATSGYALLAGLGIRFEGMGWVSVIGAALVTVGYYLSAKPAIDAKLAEIKAKKRAAAAVSLSPPPGSAPRP